MTCPGGMRLRDRARAERAAAALADEGHPQDVHEVAVGGTTWWCLHPADKTAAVSGN